MGEGAQVVGRLVGVRKVQELRGQETSHHGHAPSSDTVCRAHAAVGLPPALCVVPRTHVLRAGRHVGIPVRFCGREPLSVLLPWTRPLGEAEVRWEAATGPLALSVGAGAGPGSRGCAVLGWSGRLLWPWRAVAEGSRGASLSSLGGASERGLLSVQGSALGPRP